VLIGIDDIYFTITLEMAKDGCTLSPVARRKSIATAHRKCIPVDAFVPRQIMSVATQTFHIT